MQWDDLPGTGFTDGEPWLKVNENRSRVNAEAALADEDSSWHFYHRLIELRGAEDVLVYGESPANPTGAEFRPYEANVYRLK
ncbi:hypothetical protein QA600_11900 [Natronococcus sp. A-GB1]|uniref:alpha-amylase family glycosyl hydrolase n=1 Tax=Natronococcus sp. A-GB1 TaxID=3037648 RepID=UPI00241FE9A7|nr:hypothetical protein [Natronococcus sp. A-GB1]MDG5760044.1 hypothetical protein [Natronococcus sp. A-GB1]